MMSKTLRGWIVTLLCMWASVVLPVTPVHAEKMVFRWAILVEPEPGAAIEALAVASSPVVRTGTPMRFYVEHLSNAHVYVFLHDSSGELIPMYPPAEGYYNYGFTRGPNFIPPGEGYFSFVPPPGAETFYIIGSIQRLFKLEQLTEIYAQNATSEGQKTLLLEEIKTMLTDNEKKSRRAETIKRAEVRTKIGDEIITRTFAAVEVSISDFYGRTIVINHQ
jgi:hypothetical protein